MKPSKTNESVGKPLIDNAVIAAVAPGMGIISIPFFIAAEINLVPGSEMPGVPASETNAQLSSFSILLKT